MSMPDDPAIAAALHLLDGDEPNWDELAQAVTAPEERELIRELHALGPVLRANGAGTRSWGDLRLLERIGSGTFGEVYRSWDDRLGREVALKLLRPDAGPPEVLLDEARRLAQIRHPGVVTVHGANEHDGRVGFWMEMVRGRTLSEVIREHGPLGAREAAVIGLELCRALAAVHAAGLVHRDLKPDNVVREDGGRIVLTDFGSGTTCAARGAGVAGTPLYMAPEILEGEAPWAGSDLYSLGVLLHFLVTAAHPVEAATLAQLREAHARGPRRLRDRRPDLPSSFVRVVERALAPRAQRFRTAGELEAALGATLDPPASRRATLPLAGAAMAAGAMLAIVAVGPRPHADHPASVLLPRAGAPVTPFQARLLAAPKTGEAARAIADGDAVAPGDRLFLELDPSVELYVYVVDQDERGNAYLLFPLPDDSIRNPLLASARYRLPGVRRGRPLDWLVTSAGGREHLLIFASREPQPAFERCVAQLPVASIDRPVTALPLPPSALRKLRGIGGLVQIQSGNSGAVRTIAERLSGDAARGPWLREIVLSNPS